MLKYARIQLNSFFVKRCGFMIYRPHGHLRPFTALPIYRPPRCTDKSFEACKNRFNAIQIFHKIFAVARNENCSLWNWTGITFSIECGVNTSLGCQTDFATRGVCNRAAVSGHVMSNNLSRDVSTFEASFTFTGEVSSLGLLVSIGKFLSFVSRLVLVSFIVVKLKQ